MGVAIPEPAIQEVSERVFAYVQLDGSWGLNNAGFIVGDDSALVVDTCFTERRTRAYIEAIKRVTSLPLRTLLNTHHHGDHTHGNYLFPEATVVGHELCRAAILETGLATVRNPLFQEVDWGELRPRPPSVTFENRLILHVGDLRIEATFVGPAHTTNDIVVWIPDRGVLFSGDLVFHGGTPFVAMGSVAGSLRALEALSELGAETIVPGHGSVCGPEVIDDQVTYLRFIEKLARQSFDAGVSPFEAARGADLGTFADWHDRERIVGNLHRAYSEIRGEPLGTQLDFAVIAAEMIEYNGGPVRCLA